MLRKGENAALDGGRVRVAVTATGTPIDVSAVVSSHMELIRHPCLTRFESFNEARI
ncbi:hypothetical protein [Actinomadura sp. NPDC049753]|uniref:hypothetical protein n=1 Tax=Actinomadura sp. NPDC049753 TaxID=3154739 RepID=UPI003444F8E8